MKNYLLFKNSKHLFWYFALLMFLMPREGFGQVVFTENFNYTTGTTLLSNGYSASSGAGTNSLTVSGLGLTYTGSPSNGIGSGLPMVTSGEDVGKLFTSSISSGSAYMSFLVRFTAAQSTGDYFTGMFTGTATSPGFGLRVFSKLSGSGFVMGISKTNATAVYDTNVLTFGQTYFIVAKYTYNTSTATDDILSLWVVPTFVLGGSEGAPTITTGAGTSDQATFTGAFFRQGTAGNASTQTIDGVRAGSTWASVTSPGISISSTGTPATLSTTYGTASAPTNFSVSGSGLTASTGITITPPVGFEVATTSGFSTTIGTNASPLNVGAAGTVSDTTIYLRLAANATAGNKTGNIVLSSTGVTPSVTVATNATNTVIAKQLTISGLSVQDKTFNNTTTATLLGTATLVGIEGVGPAVTLGGTPDANFNDVAVGTGKPVTVTGYTISGADSANYTLTQPSLTGNIISSGLADQTITFGALSNVTYGVAPFALTATSNSSLPVSYVSSNDNIATISGSTITITGAGTVTITASQAGNASYNPATSVAQTLVVTPKELTVSGATASNKVYDTDTTTSITGGTLLGIINSDNVSFSGTGNFVDANVGTGKTVTGALTLSGTKAGNYFLTQPTLSANITPKELTIVGISIANKEYDTTDAATILGSASLFGVEFADGFSVSLGGSPTATFNNPSVANNKPVTVSGYTFSGSSNYYLTQPTGFTANITLKTITIVGLTADNKEYDRTLTATVSGAASLSGVLPGDEANVSLSGTPSASFLTVTAGNSKTVSVTGYSLSGTALGNYTLGALNLQANITKKEVTISGASVADKDYDGTTTATLTGTLSGVISPDSVTFNAIAAFADANVGTNKPVTSTSTISGTDAANYNLVQPTGLTASIAAIPCTIGNSGLVTWDFATAAPSSNTVTGVTVSNVSQGNNNGTTPLISSTASSSGYTGASGTNNAGAAARIGVLDTAANGSAYFEFTVTPTAGTITLTDISFGSRSTSTGPKAYTLKSSVDNFGSTTLATGTLTSSWGLYTSPISEVIATSSPVTYRLYGHDGTGNASANTANWRIDDLELTIALPPTTALSSPATASTCTGSNFTYVPTTTYSGSTITWTRAEVTGISNVAVTAPQSGNISETLVNTTNAPIAVLYSFKVTGETCFVTQDVTVTVNPIQTPTVALTSSDGDNTFAYGTPVTFTAIASSVVGNTGIVYDFKVNGVSKQNGPSAIYVVSNLANNDQVSVSIVVTGGTCMATNVATSASITNTVTGAVLVYISNYCGQTLPWLSAPINSTTAVVSGTPTVQYQFRVKRVGGASETLALRSTPSFNLTQSTLYAYNASYEVYVAAVINGVLQPESTACIISTPTTVPPAAVQSTYCGNTLADAYAPIFAVAVPGATGYSFDVYQGATHVTTVIRNVPYFYLTNIPGWTYNTVYTVFVAVKINTEGFGSYGASCTVSTPQLATPGLIACGGAAMTSVSNPVFTTGVPGATNYSFEISGPGITTTTINRNVPYFYITSIVGWNYGTVYTVKVTVTKGLEVGPQSAGCTLTTPAIPSTAVRASQCGQRMTNAASPIFADPVYGATEYRFTVTDGVNSTQIVRSVNYFYITTVSFWEYNTDYTVSVEAKRNTGSYSPIVTTCIVTTPVGPMTTIPEASCNNPTLTLSGVLSVDAYPGASSYLFTVELYNNLSQLIGTYTKVRYTNNVTLNMFPGLAAPSSLPGVTYSWGVQVGVLGKYGDITKGCSFTLIPTPVLRTAIVPFSATAYPNPFANNFMLDVKTNSQSVVNVKVYDMVGRLIEQREVRVSDMETTTIGDRYPSGVYNVVVAQEDTIETVRVIKR